MVDFSSLRKGFTAAAVATAVALAGVQTAHAAENDDTVRVPSEENRIIADPIWRWMPDQGEGNHDFRPEPRYYYLPPFLRW